jgi:nucleotidyltransferase substrate binding protein (TIGR01987 family)
MDIKERLSAKFNKSLSALDKGINLGQLLPDVKRDMVLLRFELVAELMPKVLKRALEVRGVSLVLPKDIVRAAVAGGLIDQETAIVLLEIIDSRNRMVHDYNESYAEELYKKIISEYISALKEFGQAICQPL